MSRAKEEYQRRADEAVRESASRPGFEYSGDLPIGQTWALTISKNRDSALLEQSNFDKVSRDMDERFSSDVQIERFHDPMVGWTEELAVRMLEDDGKVSRPGVAILQWADELEKYPVADEEEYSRREYAVTIENIESEGGLDEATAKRVFDWLWRNNQEAVRSVDDRGGAPTDEQIKRALEALGILPEAGEEDAPFSEDVPEQMYQDSPAQLRLWPGYRAPARDAGLSPPIG